MSQPSTEIAGLPELNQMSMRQRVVGVLRAAITSGKLKPGQRLTEEQLSAQLRISRAPLREAMRELELQGLIISEPYKGAEVLDITDSEVFELLMPLRLLIEEFGFRYAMARATESDMAALEAIVARMAQGAKKGDVDEVVAIDVEFHEAILRLTDQTHCLQIWQTISPRVLAYFARWRHKDPDLDQVVKDHRQLLDDFRKKDEAKLMRTLREHILMTRDGRVPKKSAGKRPRSR